MVSTEPGEDHAGPVGQTLGMWAHAHPLPRILVVVFTSAVIIGAVWGCTHPARGLTLLSCALAIAGTIWALGVERASPRFGATVAVGILVASTLGFLLMGGFNWLGSKGGVGAILAAFGINSALLVTLWQDVALGEMNRPIWQAIGVTVWTAVFVLGTTILVKRAADHSKLGLFWLIYWPVSLVVALASLAMSAQWTGPANKSLVSIVMLTIVPLVNIPFDWCSVGLTRWLLRLGARQISYHPALIAVCDLFLALCVLIVLGIATVVGLHLANAALSYFRPGPHIPIASMFEELRRSPRAPGNAWVYVTLLSTLVPSLINCVIGVIALVSWMWRFPQDRLLAATQKYISNPRGESGSEVILPVLYVGVWGFGVFLVYIGARVLGWLLLELAGGGPIAVQWFQWLSNSMG